jgi:hypothetical protein
LVIVFSKEVMCVADLLFWFLVSQTIAGLPDMAPGTEVRIVSSDLYSAMYASAQVEGTELTLEGNIPPDTPPPNKPRRLLVKPIQR